MRINKGSFQFLGMFLFLQVIISIIVEDALMAWFSMITTLLYFVAWVDIPEEPIRLTKQGRKKE